ncbi:23S rRNA (uracil(1939)-C(5))-methyltransferase RlmD [Orrella sp. NBD-18]|uniref:23S rRNA (uracil(1939)-C(5))-methyltransferase RlmD n=1 Tax=Sheuella amnicola TaxID=2707330 RepID=A0A6B2R3I7_9BURK|nr:23S rRNA (uracil(1939)-C(5))-methyltransferase RlmD [Sheuella amnicola]HBI84508.1 23S rRNA (uracil(1939)-C(5))-methyltransferase RlmD [Alcaligenaceae bacterium]
MSSEVLEVESLDLEARGIARREGKVVFIEGALPFERVTAATIRSKPSYEIARVDQIHRQSSSRVTPKCEHFGMCGGCVMQHLDAAAQVAVKQRALEDCLMRIGSVRPDRILPPLYGPTWGYRFRARLAVRWVAKKNTILVGFHERKSSFVADIKSCQVLPPHVSALLMPLRQLVQNLSTPDRIPQIEVAVGDRVTALVLRHMLPLTDSDVASLHQFADRHGIQWWLQSKGPDTVRALVPEHEQELAYTLPEFGLRMPYRPTDFTQVNHHINRALISRALKLLDVHSDERVADMFCGLGNFSLPIATQAREVVGIEGSASLTERAQQAAKQSGLSNATFETLNLFEVDQSWLLGLGYFDKMLIDPPREGAQALCESLVELPAHARPKRIVYVSCNPSTLARDAAIMHAKGGYKLVAAGVVNMFPHTGHVESIAVFE